MPPVSHAFAASCLLLLPALTTLAQNADEDADNDVAPADTTLQLRLDNLPPEMLAISPQGYATTHFDIRGNYTSLNIPVTELGTLFDEVYEYVSARTGIDAGGLIPVTVQPAFIEPCPPRGRASIQHIELFADASWSREKLLGVLAHELGHVLQFREAPGIGRLGGQFMQGYASWAAGRYWVNWQGYTSVNSSTGSDLVACPAFSVSAGADRL